MPCVVLSVCARSSDRIARIRELQRKHCDFDKFLFRIDKLFEGTTTMDVTAEKEGGDITYEHMVDETKSMGESEIQKFYAGATVLVTGGTGFLGKLLVEKLLRSCPEIKKIYLLARPKKNKDAIKRLQEQFDDLLYDKLRKIQPNFIEKVGIVEGDVSQVGLGLSDADKKRISDEVDIIFHGAATVRFDEALKLAVQINVRGTKEMLLLAKTCTKLRAFVHTSTAYSNCVRKHIGEEFYCTPVPAEKIIDLVDTLDDEVLENIKNGLLGDFPNTYAYTKALAEDVVRQYSKGLPVAMLRPAIVIGTASEPVAGWIDNVYGPTGVVVGAGIGLLHSLRCDPSKMADLVPGDYVVNATIAAAWRTAKDYPGNHEAPPSDLDPPVYNFVSSVDRPLTWRKFMYYNEFYGLRCPTVHAVWYYILYLSPQKWLHMLVCFLMHWIPAYIVDGALMLMGKKPMLVKAYTKIHKFSEVITYFSTQEWKFENENTKNLFRDMCPVDRNMFNFDLIKFDWNEYFQNYIRGVRVYLVKDPVETIPEGKRKQSFFKYLHYIVSCVFIYLMYKLLCLLLRSVF